MLRLFFILTMITGVLYPLGITFLAQIFFPQQSNGSTISLNGKVIGSELLAQKFVRDDLFHPRPSAGDFQLIPSAASQASVTLAKAKAVWLERKELYPLAGVDFWTASGSGVDPHIDPVTALSQVSRVAEARKISPEKLSDLVLSSVEAPTWGIWGQPRVNVLKLNIALLKDEHVHAGSAPTGP